MDRIVKALNNPILVAIVTGLFVLGLVKMIARRAV